MSEQATTSGTLSTHVREEIDHWVAKFPAGRERSAVIAALHAAQHENGGYLTTLLIGRTGRFAARGPCAQGCLVVITLRGYVRKRDPRAYPDLGRPPDGGLHRTARQGGRR